MNALVSLHDLMPETLPHCEVILQKLAEHGVPPVPLLVVPGRQWSDAQLVRLRELATQGHEIVAHGWLHQTEPRRLFHRVHAALISRKVAEHLDLDSAGILELLRRSQNWFKENKLPIPENYVPPAWALGQIKVDDLAQAPFTRIEVTRGILFPKANHLQKLPLTGYEADTPLRAAFLKKWNKRQAKRARAKHLPLRISIHPNDLNLRLADQLFEQVSAVSRFMRYDELCAGR